VSWFSTRNELHTRIRELEEENTAITQAAEKLHKSYKDERADLLRRIDNLVDDKHKLRIERDDDYNELLETRKAVKAKQAELDKAMAEVKRLDGKLVQVDCENLRLNGELATAEERLAGYEKAAA
jgi:chromosome segregation ATPase